MALDEEYKAHTPAGVSPGATSNVDEFGRAIYAMLHKLLGEPSHQDMDADIARVFGSFNSKVNTMRSQGHIVSSVAIVMAVEIWRQRIGRLSERDKEKLGRWLQAPSDYRLEDMPRIAEQIAVGMRHASEMARFEQIERSEADMFTDEVEDRTAARAREFGRDAGGSLMQAVEDFFEGLDRNLKPLYLDTLRKRLDR